MTGGVLVVCWGNPLRGDDGVGWHAADLLAADRRLGGASVLRRHQLTPELAADVAAADLVVLVDAADGGGPAGTVTVTPVEPDGAGPGLSHHLTPGALAALAGLLYGRVPPLRLVRVAAASFAPGERLSPGVEAALPAVVAAVVAAVAALAEGHSAGVA